MEKQQGTHALSNATGVEVAKIQEEMRGMTNVNRQQLQDLTRLRIERNRAARHARCATIHRA